MYGWKTFTDNENVASIRYRCLLPIRQLQSEGLNVEKYNDKNVSNYKAVIFSKSYKKDSQVLARKISENGGKVVLDLCDNHFYNPNSVEKYYQSQLDLKVMSELTDHITCSSQTLANYVKNALNLSYEPTVIGDPYEVIRGRRSFWPRSNRKKILWFGNHGSPNAPGGMEDILKISSLLEELNRYIPIELTVFSNNREKYDQLIKPLSIPTVYISWSRKKFGKLLMNTDAVVLPITINPFSECKTNNRLVTALLAGVPVIADSIPSYDEFSQFCYLNNWEDGLINALTQKPEVKIKVKNASEYIKENYNVNVIGNQWKQLLVKL